MNRLWRAQSSIREPARASPHRFRADGLIMPSSRPPELNQEGRPMFGIRRGTVVGLVILLGGRAIAGEPDDARDLVAKLKASLGAIESVQGTYRTYFSPKRPGTTNS